MLKIHNYLKSHDSRIYQALVKLLHRLTLHYWLLYLVPLQLDFQISAIVKTKIFQKHILSELLLRIFGKSKDRLANRLAFVYHYLDPVQIYVDQVANCFGYAGDNPDIVQAD